MKLLYIANARIPTEKAHGIQIIKMCEAFSSAAVEVTLVYPYRVQTAEMKAVSDPWDYYGVERNFKLLCLPSLDLAMVSSVIPRFLDKLSFFIQAVSHAFFVLIWIMFQKLKKDDVIYSRDKFSLVLILAFRYFIKAGIFFEAHTFPESKIKLAPLVFEKIDGIIVITEGLKDLYINAGIPSEKIIVASDGVDLKLFDIELSKEEARKRLELPLDKNLILYTGHLFPWKGVYTLARAADALKGRGTVILVGGTQEDIKELKNFIGKENISNIDLEGFIRPTLIPFFLKAADVLVLPNSGRESISTLFTSPLKLFEYMASKRPIVASDLPSIREVLSDGENAILVEADNPKALARGIIRLLEDRELAHRISEQSYRDVQSYSWDKRSKHIIRFISERSID
jgi:glycosyltransferase involved in cell wall biosynthesis